MITKEQEKATEGIPDGGMDGEGEIVNTGNITFSEPIWANGKASVTIKKASCNK